MIAVVLTLAAWAALVLVTEFLWRKKILRGEYARKTVHIALNTSIGLLPFYLTWPQVWFVGFVGLAAAILIRSLGLFRSLYDIKRKSWGEIVGPVAFIIIALFEPSPVLFLAVTLHVGLADGLAAVIGTKFGQSNQYKVFGYTKSIAGSITFYVTSLLITFGLILFGNIGSFASLWPLLVILPISTTVVESIGVFGMDNALIAGMVVLVFTALV